MITYLDPDDPSNREMIERELECRMFNARFQAWLARRKREEMWWNISAGVLGVVMLATIAADIWFR